MQSSEDPGKPFIDPRHEPFPLSSRSLCYLFIPDFNQTDSFQQSSADTNNYLYEWIGMNAASCCLSINPTSRFNQCLPGCLWSSTQKPPHQSQDHPTDLCGLQQSYTSSKKKTTPFRPPSCFLTVGQVFDFRKSWWNYLSPLCHVMLFDISYGLTWYIIVKQLSQCGRHLLQDWHQKIKTIKKYIKSPGCFQTNIITIINTFCLYLTILCSNTALALGSFSTPTSTSESWAVTVGRKSWKDSFSRNRKVGNDGNKLDCLGLTLFMASHDSITNFTNIFGNFLFAVSAGWRVAGAFKNHSSHRKLHWNPLSAWSNSFCGSHKNFKADRIGIGFQP